MEIDHEIFSTVVFSLPLIQERQLSVSGESMCTILVNRLVGLTIKPNYDYHDTMTIRDIPITMLSLSGV